MFNLLKILKVKEVMQNKVILGKIILVVMLIIGITASLIISPRAETFFIVAIVLFTASKSIASFLSIGLMLPLLFPLVWVGIEPGSKTWSKKVAFLNSIIPMIISVISLFNLLDFNYFLLLFLSIHFLKFSILVWDWDPQRGLGRLSFFLFLIIAKRRGREKIIKAVWVRAILPLVINLFWVSGVFYTKLFNGNLLLAILIGLLSLSLLARTLVDFFNYLKSLKLKDKTIEIFFNEGSLFYLITMTLLINLNVENIGIWFILAIIVVGDFIILQSELFRIPTFGSSHEFQTLKPPFFSNKQYFFIPLFYFLIPLAALLLKQVTILIIFSAFILIFSELKMLYAFFYENTPPNEAKSPYGVFVMNWNNILWDHSAYQDKIYEWQQDGFDIKFIYRSKYLHGNRILDHFEFVENSAYNSFVLAGDGHSEFGTSIILSSYLPTIIRTINTSICAPYKVVDVVMVKDRVDSLPIDPRRWEEENPKPIIPDLTIDNFTANDHEIEEKILTFLLQYLDKKPLKPDVKLIIETVDLPTIKLNERIKKDVSRETNFDLQNIYNNGLTPLFVLHRRTHEFSMVSTRFMELLNIIEVAVRWFNIFENKNTNHEETDLQFSFGAEVSKLRSADFANEVLFKNEVQLAKYKKILKETFGYDQKENLSFKVIDFLDWIVFVRNKTRGHGSPSRVNYELYEMVEVNLFRLFKLIADYYNPEIIVFNERFYSHQQGMNFDFKKCVDNSELPNGLNRDLEKVFFKTNQTNQWQTSNELKFINNNIYLLNAIKKGKHEWLCYNTGELIRPDRQYS